MNCYFTNEIISIKKHMHAYFNEKLKDLNLRSSEIMFIHILSHNEGLSQAELAKRMECDKAHIHRIVIKLALKKIIKFLNAKQSNKRNISIELTESGKEIATKINKEYLDWQSKLFNGISDEELSTVKNVFKKIANNLKEKENV